MPAKEMPQLQKDNRADRNWHLSKKKLLRATTRKAPAAPQGSEHKPGGLPVTRAEEAPTKADKQKGDWVLQKSPEQVSASRPNPSHNLLPPLRTRDAAEEIDAVQRPPNDVGP